MHGSEARKRVTAGDATNFIHKGKNVRSEHIQNVIFEFQEYGESAEESLLTSNKCHHLKNKMFT